MERKWAGDFRAAIEHFDAALAYLKSVTVLCEKADAHLQLGEYDEAIECCDEVIQVDPGCSRAHFIKGLAYKAKNQPAKAIECFRLAEKYGERKAAAEIRLLER
jgi:tetratricopeptide (TPR) repeat protein